MEHLLADGEDWAAILGPALCQDAAALECLARLMLRVKRAIDSGPEGAMQASRALLDSIELLMRLGIEIEQQNNIPPF